MSRRLVFMSVVAVALTLPVTATAQPIGPFHEFGPVTREGASLEIVPSDGSAEAGSLDHVASCSASIPRAAEIHLSWSKAPGGRAQRVDISKFRDGFATGRFETSGLLAADRTSVALAGPEPGIHYYWRVLTSSAGGWVSSSVERFEVPICPWDHADPSASGPGGSS